MLEWLRSRVEPMRRLPSEEQFTSPLHHAAVAARVGVWLGLCFVITFVTGWLSHEAQDPSTWVRFPTRPVSMYRVTQGAHVIAGTAAIPLLLVKLWTVYPRLFARPPRTPGRLLLVALERASIAVLVSSAVFQLTTGVMNAAQWYPWEFSFRATHEALGWVAFGSLVVHVAVKLPVIRQALGSDIDSVESGRPGARRAGALSRRGLVRGALVAAGAAVITTAGSTVPALRKVSVLAVRTGEGPQGVPINRSARAAGVSTSARAADYDLEVVVDGTVTRFGLEDLQALPRTTHELPIACVEGWSATGTWSGVVLRELLDRVDAPVGHDLRVQSLQVRGAYSRTYLPSQFADDALTLVALELNGEPLSLDHGFPCRLIAPNRPGVLQTKWLSRLEVVT